ncbi:MAG: L-seryl-tRNA(Sec) selenium transferase [Gemmataceae bacterium]
MPENPLRQLPSVHQVLEDPAAFGLIERHGRAAVAEAVRAELDDCRRRLKTAREKSDAPLWGQIATRLERMAAPALRRVINATGIVLHTNLGRAPLAEEAAQAAYDAARYPLSLELDLDSGDRRSRQHGVRQLLQRLLGAESGTAVNNCAAATVIALRTLAMGREVIVSRGQLVEIGGGFRVPEIMAASGAILREIGTTNITRLGDYEEAIGPQTALILRVHQSNFRIHGFTQSPDIADLVSLGRKHNVPVIDDVGSGALVDYAQFGLPGEPMVAESLRAGADLVLFSGDKLLGGPQAGLIVGRTELVTQIERDPMMRAMRLDKMTLAALDATLRLYLRPELALQRIPVLKLLSVPTAELKRRADAIVSQIAGRVSAVAREDVTFVGGGSLPDQTVPTVVIALQPAEGDEAFAQKLRCGEPAVLSRITGGAVLIDLRSVPAEMDSILATALTAIL